MTSFNYTWNSTFLATPADTEDASLGAQRIRDTKAATGERLTVDHSLAGDANDGKHIRATLRNRGATSAYSLDTGDGAIFASTGGSGYTELFYQDSNNDITQITSGGNVNSANPFPSNTILLFGNASPPPGWGLVGWNDYAVRIVTDGSGGTGSGSWTISGGTVQGHALSIDEMPSHDHNLGGKVILVAGSGSSGAGGSPLGNILFNSQGSNNTHTHGLSFDGSWRPSSINFCAGYKQ